MSTNGKLKNKAMCLLSCGVEDNGKILTINENGKIQLVKSQQETEKIYLTSATVDYTTCRQEIYLPVEPITKHNFFNYDFVIIYDDETAYKHNLYFASGINVYNEYLFFTYASIDKYFNIIKYQENYYYNFTSRFTFDTSLKFNLIFKGGEL